jgi:hypothetical protein
MQSVVPESLCLGPLDWNMRTTGYYEPLIPFAHYVQRRLMPLSTAGFCRFSKLPRELQLHILGFCKSAALFQLMQVSSTTRREAQKLFWSDPDAWHVVHGSWLLSGGLAGHTDIDTEVLHYVEQIEVDFAEYEPLCTIDDGEDGILREAPGKYTAQDRALEIQNFWQVVKSKLPSATHVVLSRSLARPSEAPLPPTLRMMAEQCPPGMTSYVSLLQADTGHEKRLYRSLWRYVAQDSITTGTWELLTPAWRRQSIIPPPKQFKGPVGIYRHYQYSTEQLFRRRHARRLLLLQAVEMFYTQNKPYWFICPSSKCEMRFESPSKWTLHAIDAQHRDDIVLPNGHLQVLFAEYYAGLAHMQKLNEELLATIQEAWGEDGSQQRENAKYAFLCQVQNDPLYRVDTIPEESFLWKNYTRYIDRTSLIC